MSTATIARTIHLVLVMRPSPRWGLIWAFDKSVRPLSRLVVRFATIACLAISFGRELDAGLLAFECLHLLLGREFREYRGSPMTCRSRQ